MSKNIIQQNPNTAGSLFLIIITVVFMLLSLPIVWLITLAISSRQLYKAKKTNENKKFIAVCYILMTIPLILIIINIALFVINSLNDAGVN